MPLDFRTCKMPQQYVDPTTGKKLIKEINIAIQDFRLDSSSEISSKPYIAVHVDNFGEMLYVDPAPVLQPLIDASRTNSPRNCFQTYLTDYIDASCDFLIVHSSSNFKTGDPIAVIGDLNGTNISYHIISYIDGNCVRLNNSIGSIYHAGAFVQNLANRWWGHQLGKNQVGIKTRMEMMEKPFFKTMFKDGEIKLILQTMIGKNPVKFYDVYVRDHSYSVIEPHWMPDVVDMEIEKNTCSALTFNGGKKCGGDKLKIDSVYYVSVVCKDSYGRVNVRESAISVEKVEHQIS